MRPVIQLCLCIFFISLQGALLLKMKWVRVPQWKLQGEGTVLDCRFKLEGDRLYSVKWYKDNEEFYRYVPGHTPKAKSFKVDGTHVEISESNINEVVLRNLTVKSRGTYRCEVSAEAPAFTSAHGEGRMQVMALPKGNPKISGRKEEYQPGDELELNCTAEKSYPPANLTWYINETPVEQYATIEYLPERHHGDLYAAVLGLRLVLEDHHFKERDLQIKCSAGITLFYHSPASKLTGSHHRIEPTVYRKETVIIVKNGSSPIFGSGRWHLYLTILLLRSVFIHVSL